MRTDLKAVDSLPFDHVLNLEVVRRADESDGHQRERRHKGHEQKEVHDGAAVQGAPEAAEPHLEHGGGACDVSVGFQ